MLKRAEGIVTLIVLSLKTEEPKSAEKKETDEKKAEGNKNNTTRIIILPC